jgi:hypothetical protein
MPTGTLTFNLPEEQSDFNLASNASKWYLVAWDMDQYLRNKIKYTSDDTPELYSEVLEMVRKEFWENMENNGLNFDENW